MANIDYGNMPTWISAIGTTGALLISTVLLRKALKERTEALDEKKRDQASKVSAWMDGESRSIRVRNGSEAVVDECFVFVWFKRSGLPPGSNEVTRAELPIIAVPPMTTREIELPWEEPLQWSLSGVQFRDSKGRRWKRSMGEGLVELLPPWEAPLLARVLRFLKKVVKRKDRDG
ncbi:hypothetical protein HCA58_18715 [Micromonospora sp. HNM0581]|uniref:hypothetical protein n=1 Tax=Micromonospora sp. HNM0581 TaxID=2716341 RepID=UPI00146DB5BB|nr:hypothetical protein [Micromonospora sp. HNM0581]NLU80370.1 hypothetical protein [Micromonospora sp. HNM0581]